MRTIALGVVALSALAGCRGPAPDHGAESPAGGPSAPVPASTLASPVTSVASSATPLASVETAPAASAMPVAAEPAPPPLPPRPADAALALDASRDHVFATKFLRVLSHGAKENLFFSPASVRQALAMAYVGARGGTATEIQKALEFGDVRTSLEVGSYVLATWNAARGSGDEQLRVVNRLWGQRGHRFSAEYLAALSDAYRAPLSEMDFAEAPEPARLAINDWVKDRTEGKIIDLMPPGAITKDARLVLANAVYFKGIWETPFQASATEEAPFAGAKSPVKLMTRIGTTRYAKVPGAAVAELLYAGRGMSMIVVLPDAKNGLPALERSLGARSIDSWIAALRPARVRLSLPRFRSRSSVSLNEPLSALGMRAAFSPKSADLSGIDGTRDLSISAAVHQAWIAVDEMGTEAAAATGLTMSLTSLQREEPVVFRADHPFLYFIRDAALGHVLFMGELVDPSANDGS